MTTESPPSDEELRNLAAIAELVDDSDEAGAGARPDPPGLEQTPVVADPVVDWATVGAKLIAHAERVRERARGGGKDWMSRFAECERDEEHEEEEEEEFPALKIPNKSEVTRY